jgi:hypothetical protein
LLSKQHQKPNLENLPFPNTFDKPPENIRQYIRGINMPKRTITYLSPLDALIAVAKRLSLYENQHKLDSEEFFHQYRQGKTSDEIEFIEWANDYQHYRALHQEIEQDLSDRIANDWLEEVEARDRDLTSGEVIGYPASQVFADLRASLA